jgi:hypothetical protein
MEHSTQDSAKRKNWFQRHPLISGAVVVIILLLILSAGTNNQSTTADPRTTSDSGEAVPPVSTSDTGTTSTPTWHTAYTYGNDTAVNTPPFELKGSEWRIKYTCTPSPANPDWKTFEGEIDAVKDGSMATSFANVLCPTSQTSYTYGEVPGEYYLNVDGNTVSYSVTVEDYY